MEITQRPIPKFYQTNDPRSIVLHTTLGGFAEGSIHWLSQLQVEASYHFIIDYDGVIYQLVNIENGAWHAGRWNQPKLRARTFYGTERVNQNSIGIAFARKGQPHLDAKQIASAVWLIKHLGTQTGYRYTADNIFTHKEIAIDKPAEVGTYRKEVLDELIGEKDEKDSEERTRLRLMLQYLQLQIKILTLKLYAKST